jgi:hypothetical protein
MRMRFRSFVEHECDLHDHLVGSDSPHAVTRKTLISHALAVCAAAAIIGPLLYVAVTLLHPPGIANDHPATFRQYAMAHTWIAIHLAQLVCMVLGLIGIVGVAASMFRLQENGRLLALFAVGLTSPYTRLTKRLYIASS